MSIIRKALDALSIANGAKRKMAEQADIGEVLNLIQKSAENAGYSCNIKGLTRAQLYKLQGMGFRVDAISYGSGGSSATISWEETSMW